MPGFVDYPYEGEELDDVVTAALTRLAEVLPGWTPRETHLEYALLSEVLRHVLDTRLLAADVAESVFRGFGTRLIGLPPRPGTPAVGSVVFGLSDTSGRTIPAGTSVVWTDPAAGPFVFTTTVDVTAAPGATVTPEVQVVAEEPGTDANGLPVGPVDVVDALSYVTSARSTTTSAGGTDAEADDAYLDRLAQSLTLLRRIPVLAADYAVLARDVFGVHRALALDGFDSVTGLSGGRALTVAAVDAAGQPLRAEVADALRLRLSSEREVNFVVRVAAPTYTALAVTFVVRADPGTDAAAVLADVVDAVRAFLSPAVWGGGGESPPAWRLERTVRYLDLVGVVYAVPGVANVTDVTLDGGRVDVTLAGAAPLPAAASTVTGSVSA